MYRLMYRVAKMNDTICIVVSVSEDSYKSRSKMNWRDPEFDKHEPKPWAQAEKCGYSIDKTNTDI